MKKCPSCFQASENSHNFCYSCGADIREAEIKRVCFVLANNRGVHYTEETKRFDTLEILERKVDLTKYPRWAIFRCFDEDIDQLSLFTPIAKFVIDDIGGVHPTHDTSPVTFKPSN